MSTARTIFGFHAITSRIRQHPESIQEIFLDEHRKDQRVQNLIALAENQSIRISSCDDVKLNKMAGTTHHQGVVASILSIQNRATIEAILDNISDNTLLLLLDGVKDPYNLGACLRIADAFGAQAVVVPKDNAVGLTSTVYKVASGSAESIPLISVTNFARTIRLLKQQGIWVIGAAVEAVDTLDHIKLSGPTAWVLGSEGEGMRKLTQENCDQLIRIPMVGAVNSLNVSVAAGICLFETLRQRNQR
ncbi:MAG: 23S rRNA (guanosine(2251)-2'-O)-methyltransferase RlmB [Nitrosomonas sp.]|nr:23S rRNA (guanosine(2251)-2'-O)-methyltransferase RlmB [Nitrosomonas sp.]MBK7364825.1 23S rRNA (guanosine(2251)-2'-O)-methyltransferase RlmB [Nitrosomonas sp.]